MSVTVTNQGSAAAGGFYMNLYRSTDNVITTSDTNIGSLYVNMLAAGEQQTLSFPVTMPLDSAGTYYIGAIADVYNAVVESSKSNNTGMSPATVAVVDSPDTTPPVTTATPSGGTYSTPQTVTLSANEAATIYYTTNGTTPTTGSAIYSTPLTISATTTLKYFARDTAGNMEAVKSQSYTIGTGGSDIGSIIQSVPGTYSHTFTENVTVTLTYLKGAGGGGGNGENYSGESGTASILRYDGQIKATANGGYGGGVDFDDGAPGTATNSISGTNVTGGGSSGGVPGGSEDYYGGYGGAGGAVVGGSFAALAGKTISITVGTGGMGNEAAEFISFPGAHGAVSITWRP